MATRRHTQHNALLLLFLLLLPVNRTAVLLRTILLL
jgi:hypothetical protein